MSIKKLYEGFYLSPDGLHIVELKQNSPNKHLIDVVGYDGFCVDFWFDVFKPEALIIFGAWERLK